MVREKVRSEILSGALEPNSRLRIRWLSERYSVGASPIREALSRLAPEGLITIEENRGFKVAPLSLAELIEVTQMRQILEVEAFRRAIRLGDDAWEAQIVASFHQLKKLLLNPLPDPRMSRLQWEVRHRNFHIALVAACGNRQLLQAADRLYEHLGRYRSILQVNDLPPDRLIALHGELIDVALARDGERGCAMLADHFEVNVEQIESSVQRDPVLLEMLAPM
ncbi:MAG: FCD domain-containing protein [Alphaproteobacteria bacterium]|nr:FCD domain-containing protein [Alphaproteobacteria bacterium]